MRRPKINKKRPRMAHLKKRNRIILAWWNEIFQIDFKIWNFRSPKRLFGKIIFLRSVIHWDTFPLVTYIGSVSSIPRSGKIVFRPHTRIPMCIHDTPMCIHDTPMRIHHTPMRIHHTPMRIHHTPMCMHHTPMWIHHTPMCIHHTPMWIHHTPMRIHLIWHLEKIPTFLHFHFCARFSC